MNEPRTKTKMQLHCIVKLPGAPTTPMSVPDLTNAVLASTTVEDSDRVEVTQSGMLDALLPFDAKHERLTDWRITRAWCKCKNTAPITDRIVDGDRKAATDLADHICGKTRTMIPRLYKEE